MTAHFTPERLIGPDAISAVGGAIVRHGLGKNLMLVCDDATWTAAGQSLHATLHGKGITLTPHSLGRQARALLSSSEALAAAGGFDGFLAVGSGTVNDITKYAAAQQKKPYLCVATAASMNGYTSANASLEVNNAKMSYPALPPRAVIADTDIISAAPRRLARAGLGDTLARSSVEADMLMSHLLLDTPYPRDIFATLRAHEPDLIAAAPGMREGDKALILKLIHALLDAGDAMTQFGTSAVASQGEHMIAHTAEIMYGAEYRQVLHGELVAITTNTMNHLQQKVLLAQPHIKPLPREEGQFTRIFGKLPGLSFARSYENKLFTPAQCEAINARLNERWAEIKAALFEVMLPPNTVERAFMQAGIATRPNEIGMAEDRYRMACTYAHMSRDRFTFLDLAAMNDKRI